MQSSAKKIKVCTLLMIHQQNKLLLGMKKRGFGANKYNGFGGKVEPQETIFQAALRETKQQSGVTPLDAVQVGLINFEFKGDPTILEVHLFKATQFEGTPVETEEMRPEWFQVDKIPYERMWVDDRHWFPYMLGGKKIRANFLFQGHETILEKSIQEVEGF